MNLGGLVMKLKISLFDKNIIKSDIKRFWWIGAIYAVVLLFILPMQHMQQVLPLKDEWQKEALLAGLRLSTSGAPYSRFGGFNIQVLLVFTVPVILAVLLFSYLHSTRAATMVHSLPLKRTTLLGSHTASGIMLFSLPVLLTAAVLSIFALFTGLGEYYSVLDVLKWIGLTLTFDMLFFSTTVFVGMFTGNSAAHITFTYILNILPYGIYLIVAYTAERLLYGFSPEMLDSAWMYALPVMKLAEIGNHPFTIVEGLIYLLTAFIFIGAAGLAYNRRKLEAAGNIIAFETLQPVFKYGFAICLMFLGGFTASFFYNSGKSPIVAACLVFAVAGYWIPQMLIEKSVKVWRAYKGFLVFGAVVALMLAGLSADVTGYEKYIPAADEIENVYFGYNMGIGLREEKDFPKAELSKVPGIFTEDSNISSVLRLHRALIHKGYNKTGYGRYIIYMLKNGKVIQRKYVVDEDSVKGLVKPVYESLEYKEDRYPVLNQKPEDIKYIEIGDNRTRKKPFVLADAKQLQSFTDIMRGELKEAVYDEITAGNEFAYIRITDRDDNTKHYELNRSYDTIFAWLENNGCYSSALLTPEDIDHVGIRTVKITKYGANGYGYSTGDAIEGFSLGDKSLIQELLNIYEPDLDGCESGNYILLDFFGTKGAVTSDFGGYLYPDTKLSGELRQKIIDAGIGW